MPPPPAVESLHAIPIHTDALTASSVPTHYTVRNGDTLSKIAQRLWHRSADWPALYYANRNRIRDFNSIHTGRVLHVPAKPTHTPRMPYVRPAPVVVTAAPAATPIAATAPAAPSSSGTYSYGALESLWVRAGGPASVEASAATIAECESGGNPNAYNPSGASGLWQILGAVVPGNLFNAWTNALNAVKKYRDAGDSFAPWVCQA